MISRLCCLFSVLLVYIQLSSSVQPTPTIRDGNDEKQIICQYFLYDADSIRTQRELIDNNQCNHIIEYDRITGKADSELFVTRDSDLRNDFYSLIPRWRESGIRVSIGIQMTCTFYEERVQETPVKRARFIQSIIEFMKRQSFDGFAVYRADEMCSLPLDANFMSFLSELSVALQSDGLSLAITTTNDALVRPEFDVKELSNYVDWLILFRYEQPLNETRLLAPVYFYAGDVAPKELTTNWTVNYLSEKGVPLEKIILTVPTFVRLFITSSGQNGLNVPAVSNTFYTPLFSEICPKILKKNYKVVHDDRVGTYAYRENYLGSYFDVEDAYSLGEYIVQNNLGGGSIMPFVLGHIDDICGCGQTSLLNGLVQGLRNVTVGKATNCT